MFFVSKQVYVKEIQIMIAILGYGTVGKGVYKLSKQNNINVKYVLVRDINRKIDVDCLISDDIDEIINDKEVDTIVECIGGDDIPFEYCKKAILNKKNVVSSNKKMLVKYLKELNELAISNNVSLLYSGACGGGIPILHEIKRIASIDEITQIKGIMNGTSNYILDKMFSEDVSFKDTLKKAQELGYAEKDPSDDIDGIDSANKLILACLLAYKKAYKLDDVFVKGIRNIDIKDIKFFKSHDYKCVLLASTKNGCLKVVPTIFKHSIFSNIHLNNNCFMIHGRDLGPQYFIGQGAGSLPTASNVIRDIKDINNRFNIKIDDYDYPNYLNECAKYYIRINHIEKQYVDSIINDNTYITKPINIETLKKIINDEDFICEVSDD